MLNYFNSMKLRTKIMASILFASTMLVLGGLIAFENFSAKYSHEVYEKSTNMAQSLGQNIATQFYERYGDIQAFAVNSTVKSLNAKSLTPVLNQYVELYGIYDLIIVTDKNGKFVASNTFDSSKKISMFQNFIKRIFLKQIGFNMLFTNNGQQTYQKILTALTLRAFMLIHFTS